MLLSHRSQKEPYVRLSRHTALSSQCLLFKLLMFYLFYLLIDMPIINGLLDERRERISIRRELKRKCQEEYLPKERLKKDNSAPQIALGADSIQLENMQQFSQSGITRYINKDGLHALSFSCYLDVHACLSAVI